MFKKENKNNAVDKNNNLINNKDLFFNELKRINFNLDLLRNGIFNIIVTADYINNIEFDFKNFIININNNIVELNKEISNIIEKLNIKFGDKKNVQS